MRSNKSRRGLKTVRNPADFQPVEDGAQLYHQIL